jgi:hypothetical protein
VSVCAANFATPTSVRVLGTAEIAPSATGTHLFDSSTTRFTATAVRIGMRSQSCRQTSHLVHDQVLMTEVILILAKLKCKFSQIFAYILPKDSFFFANGTPPFQNRYIPLLAHSFGYCVFRQNHKTETKRKQRHS